MFFSSHEFAIMKLQKDSSGKISEQFRDEAISIGAITDATLYVNNIPQNVEAYLTTGKGKNAWLTVFNCLANARSIKLAETIAARENLEITIPFSQCWLIITMPKDSSTKIGTEFRDNNISICIFEGNGPYLGGGGEALGGTNGNVGGYLPVNMTTDINGDTWLTAFNHSPNKKAYNLAKKIADEEGLNFINPFDPNWILMSHLLSPDFPFFRHLYLLRGYVIGQTAVPLQDNLAGDEDDPVCNDDVLLITDSGKEPASAKKKLRLTPYSGPLSRRFEDLNGFNGLSDHPEVEALVNCDNEIYFEATLVNA